MSPSVKILQYVKELQMNRLDKQADRWTNKTDERTHTGIVVPMCWPAYVGTQKMSQRFKTNHSSEIKSTLAKQIEIMYDL